MGSRVLDLLARVGLPDLLTVLTVVPLPRYAWASVFAIEMLEATAIAQFWNSGSSDNYIVMSVAFYVITPLVLVVLNYPGVQVGTSDVLDHETLVSRT